MLRYLKESINYDLTYCDFPSVLEGCSDANWISSVELKSTSVYVFTLGAGAMSWNK